MTPSTEPISRCLEGLRSSLAVDGGTLDVVGLDGTTLQLALALAPDACQDCIVPDEMIEQMVLAAVSDLGGVTVEDVQIEHRTRA